MVPTRQDWQVNIIERLGTILRMYDDHREGRLGWDERGEPAHTVSRR